MDEKSKRGAKAFGEYYYALVNYGRGTNDWAPLEELSLPSCKECKDFWTRHPSRFDGEHRLYIKYSGSNFMGDYAIMSFVVSLLPPKFLPENPGVQYVDEVDITYRDGQWRVKSIQPSDIGG